MQARSLEKTLGQSGQKSSPPTLSALPEDELFCLSLLLDFETIFNLKQVSTGLKTCIEHILEKIQFWERFPALNITKDNAKSFSAGGYGKLMAHSTQIFENNLLEVNKKFHNYYNKSLTFSFFKGKNIYQNQVSSYDFTVIQPLLLKDQASTFFRKTSRLGNLIPFIQEDNFDLDSIKDVIRKFEDNSNLDFISSVIEQFVDNNVGRIITDDLNFIGLLPNLIMYKAQNCFDLVVRAYLGLHACYPQIQPIQKYSLNEVRNLILHANDNKYINPFIELMIKLYPVDDTQSFLYEQIQFFCDNNRTDMVYESLRKIPEKRKMEILDQWKKLDLYSNLLGKFYTDEEGRYNLQESLEKALEFVKNNPHLSIEELLAHQKIINTSFNSFFERFHSNNENFLKI